MYGCKYMKDTDRMTAKLCGPRAVDQICACKPTFQVERLLVPVPAHLIDLKRLISE